MDFLTKDLLLKKRTSFSFLFGSKKPTFALHDDNLDDQPPRYYDLSPQKPNENAIARNEAEDDEDDLLSTRQELSPELEAQVRYACSLLVYRIEQGISSNYCPNRAKEAAAARKKRISTITATSTLSGSSAAAAAQVEAKYLLSSTTKKLRNGMIGRFGNGIFARDGSEKHDSGVGLTQQPSIATMREGQRSKLGSSHSNYTTTHREDCPKAERSQVGATAAVARGEESMIVSPISPTAPEGEEDVIISPITVSTTTTTTTQSETTVYRTVPTSLSPTDSSNNGTSSEDTSPTSSVDHNQQHIHHLFLTRGAAAATGDAKTPCQRDQDTATFLSPTDPVPVQHNPSVPTDESPDATNDSDVEVFLDADTAAEYITSSAGGVGGVGVGPGGVAMPLLTTSTPSLGLTSTNPTSVRQSRVYNPPAAATGSSILITEAEITGTEEEDTSTSKPKRHSTYTPTYPAPLPHDETLSGTEGGEDEPPTIIDMNGNAHVMTSAEELERDLGLQQAVMTKMKTGSILLLSSSSSASSSPTTEGRDSTERTHVNPREPTTDSGTVPGDSPTPTLPRLPEPTHIAPPRRPGTSASRLKTSWSALSHSTASVSGKLRRRFRRHDEDDDDDDDDDDSVLGLETESRRPTPATTLFRRLAGWLTGRGSPREKEEEDHLPRMSSGLEGVLPYQGT
ncbi:hypothetical protein BO86DRAFT_405210 [Aspergillus japonicus CBS 114.51]|uniref:Uncharacterized protein n=1 Tax=Aspergillus japonicus CBS 114.51 TaxID=1448312 RepID=A0A8T8WJD4_ASPJA|nr:hypothetical protein BO86DRAFT_405210 [Aspergillus japonicus CBS 114.51]RAH75847.1 hypothetical protein BO86DRAFT_405210 [Aspergillus japonicus CBS 114.51]